MLHDILVKRKSILEQFRKGLSTLGFLAEMEHNPLLFEEFLYVRVSLAMILWSAVYIFKSLETWRQVVTEFTKCYRLS